MRGNYGRGLALPCPRKVSWTVLGVVLVADDLAETPQHLGPCGAPALDAASSRVRDKASTSWPSLRFRPVAGEDHFS